MSFATQLASAFVPIAAVYDTGSVTRALTWSQSFVETYCNQVFDAVLGETVVIDPAPHYRQAMLPQVPVLNVTLVQGLLPQANTSVPTGGLVWTALTNYAWIAETGLIYDTTGQPGVTWNTGPSWPWIPGSLMVTYDHGYSNVPQPLIDVACRVAQQYLENPSLQLQRRVADMEDRYAGSAGVLLNALDKAMLGRFRDYSIA